MLFRQQRLRNSNADLRIVSEWPLSERATPGSAYRFGALHHLAELAWRRNLPEAVHPGQVRAAMTAVMKRMADAPGTFDAKGWLTINFSGHRPSLGETYISTGSLYLCACAWLPLGLSVDDPFWDSGGGLWTQRKIWNGVDIGADHAIAD